VSASEKRTGASERGPSTARASTVGIARCRPVGLRVLRKGEREPGRTVEPGCGTGEVPGWRESATRRFTGIERCSRVVGPGWTSREAPPPDPGKGSLMMEGTSGRHVPRSFTRARSRRPRLLSPNRPARLVRTRARRDPRTKVWGARGRGWSDRGVRGTVSSSAEGRIGPWSRQPGETPGSRRTRSRQDPPKRW